MIDALDKCHEVAIANGPNSHCFRQCSPMALLGLIKFNEQGFHDYIVFGIQCDGH
jgi:hypothetical protein